MLKRLIVSVTIAAFIAASLLVPTVYATGSNKGTIKIKQETAQTSPPSNQPHVSCKFRVDFFNFKTNNAKASVKFALHAPTTEGRTLTVTEGNLNPFIGGGAVNTEGLVASEVYALGFTGSPHPKQGYHVKVSVNAPGAQGKGKHKVFWVKPCPAEQPTTPTTPTTPVAPTTSTGHVLGASQPSELPKTGMGNVLGIFAATSVAGTIAHKLVWARRFSR